MRAVGSALATLATQLLRPSGPAKVFVVPALATTFTCPSQPVVFKVPAA